MKSTDWRSYAAGIAAGIAAVLVGLFFGGFVFGMLVHESGHAIVCLLFGLPYSWSLTRVVYVRSQNPLVNNLVGLAGGMAQASFSLLFFWYVTTLEKKVLVQSFYNELLKERRSPKRSILFGFELAFLTIAFHGAITGIWEGLFYQSYEQIHDNFLVWGTIILLCGIIAFYILYKRHRSIRGQLGG